jgi:hypothetical protein
MGCSRRWRAHCILGTEDSRLAFGLLVQDVVSSGGDREPRYDIQTRMCGPHEPPPIPKSKLSVTATHRRNSQSAQKCLTC